MKLIMEFILNVSYVFIISVSLISFMAFVKNRCKKYLANNE